jgi:ABC-2 type transport system ATP-binding protein
VEATCDRILIINKGKIVADGTVDELRKHAQDREILKVTIEEGDVNDIFKGLQSLDSVEMVDFIDKSNQTFEVRSVSGKSARRDVFELCVEKGWVLTQLSFIETRLEDVFRELTVNN